jgi:hypothetical protein
MENKTTVIVGTVVFALVFAAFAPYLSEVSAERPECSESEDRGECAGKRLINENAPECSLRHVCGDEPPRPEGTH